MNIHDDALQQAVAAAAVAEYPASAVEADLAEATNGLAEDSDSLAEISRQVEETGNVAESMESFLTSFMGRVPEGEWDARTSRQYRLGMTQILAAHGYSTDPNTVSASFESAGVTQTNDENRKESKDKSSNIIARLYEALKAAMISMGQVIKRFVNGIFNNATVVRKAGQQLHKSATAAKGEVPTGHFEKPPAWAVYYQGKNGSEMDAAEIVKEVSLELNGLLGGWDHAFRETIKLYSTPGHTDASRNVNPTKNISVVGGIILECQYVDEKLAGAGATLAKADIKVVKAKMPEHKVPYLTKAQIHAVADAMIAAADHMRVMADMSKPIQQELDKLLEQLKKSTGERKAEFSKSKDLVAGSEAVSGKNQITLVRQMIAKYPLAMRVLIPQVAGVAMNAWRHSQYSLTKISTSKADDKGSTKPTPAGDEDDGPAKADGVIHL